jgi:G:T-mismatch repair DNA endonuclease (very short patch repair protein)
MPAKIVLDDQTIEKICNDFKMGNSIPEIMKVFKLGRNKITDILKTKLGNEYQHYAKMILSATSAKGAHKRIGKKQNRTPEWNKKISESQKGKIISKETRKKISESCKEEFKNRDPKSIKKMYEKIIETKKLRGYFEIHSKRHSAWLKENHPFKGKKHTKETKKKMRNSKKNFFKNGGKPSRLGIKHNAETIKKLSEKTKKMWIEGKFKYFTFRSKLEIKIFEEIKKIYENAKHSFHLSTKVFDVYVPEKNLLIEINGDYWHLNPAIYKEDHFDEYRNIYAKQLWENDARKMKLAQEAGFSTLTIWELDINNEGIESIIKNLFPR